MEHERGGGDEVQPSRGVVGRGRPGVQQRWPTHQGKTAGHAGAGLGHGRPQGPGPRGHGPPPSRGGGPENQAVHRLRVLDGELLGDQASQGQSVDVRARDVQVAQHARGVTRHGAGGDRHQRLSGASRASVVEGDAGEPVREDGGRRLQGARRRGVAREQEQRWPLPSDRVGQPVGSGARQVGLGDRRRGWVVTPARSGRGPRLAATTAQGRDAVAAAAATQLRGEGERQPCPGHPTG